MGTPEFSVEILKTLKESNYEIACVYTQSAKKSSRGQKLKKSPTQLFAELNNLKIRHPISLSEENEYNFFKSLNAYIVIVVAYGKIIPKKYLQLAEKGFINIHASLLPKWRGAAPIQRSIMNNDSETGISFMRIEEGLDTGPYMKKIKVKIDQHTNSRTLSKKLSKIGAENIINCIQLIENNEAQFISQNNDLATYAKKIEKSESKINWDDDAKKILLKINGLNPDPGAWFEFEGSRYKVWKGELSNLKGSPGKVLDDKLTVGCKENSLKILEIQKEGKKRLLTNNFLIGTKILKGKNLF